MFMMNAVVVNESDLEINAYLNSLSLHQSFEEDDSEDDEFYTANPSGSVLQPTNNPYNKQKKIAEANESLFAEEITPKSPQKVKFNKVEKRICYDYFGSSFESDSIKSYEEEESEREGLLQDNGKSKSEQSTLDVRGTHLQTRNPASKVVVTVTPKTEQDQDQDPANSESESEDVCVGSVAKETEPEMKMKGDDESQNNDKMVVAAHSSVIVKEQEKTKQSSAIMKEQEKTKQSSAIMKEQEKTKQSSAIMKEQEKTKQSSAIMKEQEKTKQCSAIMKEQQKTKHNIVERNDSPAQETRPEQPMQNIKKSKTPDLRQTDNLEAKKSYSVSEKTEELVFLELEKPDTNSSEDFKEHSDFYPCLANHAGITIRITGADSIESVESESTDNEVQTEENYSTNIYNIVELRPENKTFVSKTYQNSRMKETTYKVSKDSFILRGTKSTQNVRSPKSSQKPEPDQKAPCKKETQKESNVSKMKTEKTEMPFKVQKSKLKETFHKSKQFDDDSNKKTDELCTDTKKVRPKSCVEKASVKVKTGSRPLTAPVKRSCCQWGQPHLPEYNGLRSEYGLSAEQLMERKRHKIESLKMQKQRKEQKHKEEIEKRKENEAKFIAWLEDKRKQAQMQFLRNQKIKAESGIKIYPAPTAHLKRTGAIRSRRVFKSQRKCVSLEELLNNASSHEKKTYKIYLGLSFE